MFRVFGCRVQGLEEFGVFVESDLGFISSLRMVGWSYSDVYRFQDASRP